MSLGPPNRFMEPPSHTGELLEAVAAGLGITTISVLVVSMQPLLLVTVKT
jgi:hypothetical protein